MSNIAHYLVGYDRKTEDIADEFTIPDALLDEAKALAHVPADDPDVTVPYALDGSAARDLAGALRVTVDPATRDYYLEGFAAD